MRRLARLNCALAAGVLAVGALSGAEAGSVLWQGVRGAYSNTAAPQLAQAAGDSGARVAALDAGPSPTSSVSVASSAAFTAAAVGARLAPEPRGAASEQAELERKLAHALAAALLVGF